MNSSLLYTPFSGVLQLHISNEDYKYIVRNVLADLQLPADDFYVLRNGRPVAVDDVILAGCCYRIQPRLLGGKGGFGSMLRALGAQIEKTTNREACRDLSGRRMRDVNNEKKLREWASKASEREKAREERRMERRERLKAGPVKHKFSDPEYDQQKTRIADNLDEALREALQKTNPSCSTSDPVASCSGESRKRKAPSATVSDPKKACDWIGVEVELSSSSSDSESSDDEISQPAASRSEDSDSSSNTDSQEQCSSDPAGDSVIKDAIPCNKEILVTITGNGIEDINSSRSDEVSVESKSHSTQEAHNGEESSILQHPVNLDDYNSAASLETLGLDILKAALMDRGLKCGGTLQQRAQRLFSVKGLSVDQIDKSLLAKQVPKKK